MEISQENMCWNLFLITLQAFRPGTLLKMDFNTGVSVVKFAKVFKNTCFENVSKGRLLILVTKSLFFAAYWISCNLFELNARYHKCLIDILWKVDKILLGNIHTCFECTKTQNRKNFMFGHFLSPVSEHCF